VLGWFVLLAAVGRADDQEVADRPYAYAEATSGDGRLFHMEGVPVMVLAGTPAEIGDQAARLASEAVNDLVDFPKLLMERREKGDQWPAFRSGAQIFRLSIPRDHMRELEAVAHATDIATDRLVAANVMPDVYRAFGCSSLIVAAERSTTGGPLFGRNLDFFTLGLLHRYGIVTVVRPEGKHAFASVGFPGLVGVVSGMNDAGLALAVHEVPSGADRSRLLNPMGVPYTMIFRRILEECTTVDEAEKLLRSVSRTTLLNLAVCDRHTSAVLELTPATVERREGEEGITICTNHFRTERLCTSKECERFDALRTGSRGAEKISLERLQLELDAAHQGDKTLQSMIFEPVSLRLHVSLWGRPATRGPYHTLELEKLLAP
jgi:predicted choloylglycine hydrolase